MIWLGTAPDALSNPGFETDVSGWALFSTIGSTVTLDPVAPALGSASAHVTVPVAGAVSYSTAFSTNGIISITAGLPNAATFWARSDHTRKIWVVAARTTSGQFTSQQITIG